MWSFHISIWLIPWEVFICQWHSTLAMLTNFYPSRQKGIWCSNWSIRKIWMLFYGPFFWSWIKWTFQWQTKWIITEYFTQTNTSWTIMLCSVIQFQMLPAKREAKLHGRKCYISWELVWRFYCISFIISTTVFLDLAGITTSESQYIANTVKRYHQNLLRPGIGQFLLISKSRMNQRQTHPGWKH